MVEIEEDIRCLCNKKVSFKLKEKNYGIINYETGNVVWDGVLAVKSQHEK